MEQNKKQNRTKKVTVRFTQEEFEKLKEKAEFEGITVSDFVRKSVLRLKPRKVAKECKELAYHLAKIGNNINQIARRTNKNREVDFLALEELLKIRETLVMLASEVLQ